VAGAAPEGIYRRHDIRLRGQKAVAPPS